MDFITWLKTKSKSDSIIGDLARDLIRTKHDHIKTYNDLLLDMRSRRAHSDALRALDRAHKKFKKELQAKNDLLT